MELFIYSIYDEKIEAYNTPFFSPTNPSAIRQFTDLANSDQTTISSHPYDFTLYQVGKWNDTNAQIEAFENPVNLGKAADYMEEKAKLKSINTG